jgi:hypothetical protein
MECVFPLRIPLHRQGANTKGAWEKERDLASRPGEALSLARHATLVQEQETPRAHAEGAHFDEGITLEPCLQFISLGDGAPVF